MTFDDRFPYPSRRMPVMASNVVATSQPLAAQAGLAMLQAGGNAVDAALAAAITLTVVEPTGNGIGGDAFAIIWDGSRLHGLNASGMSAKGLDPAPFLDKEAMPARGWDSVTVPGAVSAWVELSRRFGQLPFERLFEAAIGYAREGFLVSPVVAKAWARAQASFGSYSDFAEAFLPSGRAPKPGERFALPAQGDSLAAIAGSRGEEFYKGSLADKIVADAKRHGHPLTHQDLAEHACEWVEPITKDFLGAMVHEIPPNTQGIAALIMLGIVELRPEAGAAADSADSLHLHIEATKLALADTHAHVADPRYLTLAPTDLLDSHYLAERAAKIDMRRAQDPGHGSPRTGGTVYLAAGDAQGRMVSYIQSNYQGFGSGVVIPGTGISMHNRGAGFSNVRGSPNMVGPAKRPFHTIIPGFVSEEGMPLIAFGVMGGPMQAQGHAQVLIRMMRQGLNPQAAIDAPRWRVMGGLRVNVEAGFDAKVLDDLATRGHDIEVVTPEDSFAFGGAQVVQRVPGGFVAASESRKDGQAVGF